MRSMTEQPPVNSRATPPNGSAGVQASAPHDSTIRPALVMEIWPRHNSPRAGGHSRLQATRVRLLCNSPAAIL